MKLQFYCVDAEYCDFLRKVDTCVPFTFEEKSTRPFIGVLIHVNHMDYFAPLTSPKPKHLSMKNQIDFMKLADGKLGAVNFNNMIPVHKQFLHKIDLKIKETDTNRDKAYKNLLQDQLSWCIANEKQLSLLANKLYLVITSGRSWESLRKRCCNFKLIEQQAEKYKRLHNIL